MSTRVERRRDRHEADLDLGGLGAVALEVPEVDEPGGRLPRRHLAPVPLLAVASCARRSGRRPGPPARSAGSARRWRCGPPATSGRCASVQVVERVVLRSRRPRTTGGAARSSRCARRPPGRIGFASAGVLGHQAEPGRRIAPDRPRGSGAPSSGRARRARRSVACRPPLLHQTGFLEQAEVPRHRGPADRHRLGEARRPSARRRPAARRIDRRWGSPSASNGSVVAVPERAIRNIGVTVTRGLRAGSRRDLGVVIAQ